MIRAAHMVVYSADAESDRAFLRDVLGFPFVDAGNGWLIFALPPAELAVHPAGHGGAAELFFTVDDIDGFVAEMSERGVACAELHTERWGRVTHMALPGGGHVGVYQPTHVSPRPAGGGSAHRAESR